MTFIMTIRNGWRSPFASTATTLIVVLAARSATANPRPLPFTYPYATLPEGSLELEVYSDVTPLRVYANAADTTRGRLWAPMYQLQNELEYGLTDRWELGFYQVFQADPRDGGDNQLMFDGLKWRVRTRLAEAGEWPVDVGLYLELEAMHDEVSLEEKVNLERRFGALRLMANLWVEERLYRPFDAGVVDGAGRPMFIINPTLGATYQVTPTFHPGLEYWARGLPDPGTAPASERSSAAVRNFLGPTVHLNFGKLWWSTGLYVNLNDQQKPAPGDAWGPWWFRTVLGLELGT
jgi:hypothetical protein